MTFVATNPTTGDTIASYPVMPKESVNESILAAQEAHLIWRNLALSLSLIGWIISGIPT